MIIIGFIMAIYAAIVIPGAGRVVDNKFVPSPLMPYFVTIFVIGIMLFLIGIVRSLFSFIMKLLKKGPQ